MANNYPCATANDLRSSFLRMIAGGDFPCVGAKSALARDGIETLEAPDICSAWSDLMIHQELCDFGKRLRIAPERLHSFAVLFRGPKTLSEGEFERALWQRLQSLRDKDGWLSYRCDPQVDPDPLSPEFAFSIGGVAYFVVGMHPHASRMSRRTPMPVLVFNPFSQFQNLRAKGRYHRMSDVVRQRDAALCGSDNPMLADHGDASAARQFSGRRVEADWTCPLSPALRA